VKKTLRGLAFASLMMLGGVRAYAQQSPPLCCSSFDGTDAYNCTPASNNQCNSGVLVIFNCNNQGPDGGTGSTALECSPSNTRALGLLGQNGNTCRCVTALFGAPN